MTKPLIDMGSRKGRRILKKAIKKYWQTLSAEEAGQYEKMVAENGGVFPDDEVVRLAHKILPNTFCHKLDAGQSGFLDGGRDG